MALAIYIFRGKECILPASSEVEVAEDVEPAGRIPGPAGDGVVDDSAPDEHENDTGQETTALSDSADGKSNAEHVSAM